MTLANDEFFMRRALDLAKRGLGKVEPNPMVGAIVHKDGQIVGEGFHRKFGGPHAEVLALRAAGDRARGATLYVTLEPCCHFGKTPPCVDAIFAAGISRVVCATLDPFPKVNGRGVRILRKHGIEVTVGVLAHEARDMNRAFIKRIKTHKPYVIAKWAQTLDGAVATASGESRWISSTQSRQLVHILRGRMDAIIIGLGTALQDDPLLTARPANHSNIKRIATRIVMDSHCNLPVNSQLVRTAGDIPLMVACAQNLLPAAKRRAAALARKGAVILSLPTQSSVLSPQSLLKHLYQLGHTNILVEGGPHVLGSFFARNEIDEAHVFIAPRIVPGARAIRPILGTDMDFLRQAPRLQIESSTDCGGDLYVVARPQQSQSLPARR